MSGDGKHLYLADPEKTVRVVDTASSKLVRTFRVDAECYRLALSADEKWCALPGPGNIIKVWNAQTGAEWRCLKGLDERVHRLMFSPNASRLLGADEGGVLKTWDIATGSELAATKLSDICIQGVCFSPDGNRLVVFGQLNQFLTGELRVLDGERFRETRSLKGHTVNVLDVAFSPDGQRLATVSADWTVRIWNLSAGQEILKVRGPEQICRLRFVPDGHRLITASFDRTIRVWDATPLPDE